MSRRDLGYFPRARRKASYSFSDLDTPSLSLELPRSSLQSAAISDTSPPATGPNANSKPATKHRHRSSSTASQKQWATAMLGPGGVGTLTGKGTSAPGPSEDKLNKVLKKHLPNLAPPPAPAAWEEDDYAGAPRALDLPASRILAAPSKAGSANLPNPPRRLSIKPAPHPVVATTAASDSLARSQARPCRDTGLTISTPPRTSQA